MNPRPSMLFLFESGLASAAVVLAAVSTFWRDWIEWVFGLDLDHQSGSLEWMVVAALVLAGLTLALLARLEWRRGVRRPAVQSLGGVRS